MYRTIITDESARCPYNKTDYDSAFQALNIKISRVYEYIEQVSVEQDACHLVIHIADKYVVVASMPSQYLAITTSSEICQRSKILNMLS